MKRHQSGYFTFTVIVLLAIMLVTTLSLVRSSSVSNIISGNISFKKASAQYADVGVSLALNYLDNVLGNFEANSADNIYYAKEQPVDANGIPTTVNWANVASTAKGNFTIQYVIERLCQNSAVLPIANTNTQCLTIFTGGNLNQTQLYYRVTVRVTGPSNALTYIQSILLR